MKLMKFMSAVLLTVLLFSCGNSTSGLQGKLDIPNNIFFRSDNFYEIVFVDSMMYFPVTTSTKDDIKLNGFLLKGNRAFYNVLDENDTSSIALKKIVDQIHIANLAIEEDGSIAVQAAVSLTDARDILKKMQAREKEARKQGTKYIKSKKEMQARWIINFFSNYLEEGTYKITTDQLVREGDCWKLAEVNSNNMSTASSNRTGTYVYIDDVEDVTIEVNSDNTWTATGYVEYEKYSLGNIELSGSINAEGQLVVENGTFSGSNNDDGSDIVLTVPKGYVFGGWRENVIDVVCSSCGFSCVKQ